MKIAICGSSRAHDDSVEKKAFEIGVELAKNNILALTGAGKGYPYQAARGAFANDGKVFGISPAKNKEEHDNVYGFPNDAFTEMEYTGLGIPGRNFPLVKEADAIIVISGQIGSLNEFTIAFHYSKVIGVLADSGGVTGMLEQISQVCDKRGESKNIVYSSDPKELVSLVLSRLKE